MTRPGRTALTSMKTRIHPGLLPALLLGGVVAAAPPVASAQPDRGVEPADRLEAVIPSEVRGLPLENPSVTFLVRVDETGRLVESMPLAATHYKLIPAAEKVLAAAAFKPALAAGQPVPATGQVAVGLYDPEQRAYLTGIGQLPFGHAAGDAVVNHFYWSERQRLAFHRSKPGELDHPVEVAAAKMMLYTDAAGRPARGRCVVEYWVDAAGAVKFPRIVASDNEAVSLSALLTLQQTRFVPPTHEGLPTYVQVRQAMEFNTETAPPAGVNPPG